MQQERKVTVFMKRINEDIKSGNLKQIYLLCGEEDYLRNQYRNRLKDALLNGGDTMNLSIYEGKDIKSGFRFFKFGNGFACVYGYFCR